MLLVQHEVLPVEYVDESEADRLLVVVVNDHQGGGAGGSSGMKENGLRFSSMASLDSSSSLLSNLGMPSQSEPSVLWAMT